MNKAPHNPEVSDASVFEDELQAALERKPIVPVSMDFAARVASRISVLPAPQRSHTLSFGRMAAGLSLALLLVTMFALVPWTQPGFNNIAFDVDLLATAQLLTIAWWITVRRPT